LIGPIVIGYNFVFGDAAADFIGRSIVKSIFSEEVVPKNEDRRDTLAIEVMIPFFEESNQLVALLSHLFVREEQKFGLPVDLDKEILSLLDERITIDTVNEFSQTFGIEFANRRYLSANIKHKLLLSRVLNLSLQIAVLVHGG
jgi:hypothetical protein